MNQMVWRVMQSGARLYKIIILAVVRVSNAEVDQNFFGVCEFIDRRIKEELSKWED